MPTAEKDARGRKMKDMERVILIQKFLLLKLLYWNKPAARKLKQNAVKTPETSAAFSIGKMEVILPPILIINVL